MVALFIALGGTSFAASKVITAKHKDAKADTKLVKKLAPKLSVKHAKTADERDHGSERDPCDECRQRHERHPCDERRQRHECHQRHQRH